MTIKKRIFIANTGMVLISLLILLGIGGTIVELFNNEFMKIIEQNSQLAENTYEVQGLLLTAKKQDINWEKLSENLGTYNFELYVSDNNGNQQYSNVRDSEWESIEELEDSEFVSDKVILYNMENVTIAKCRITHGDIDYNVYAAYYPGELSFMGMDRGMFEMFLIVFIITGILAITALLFCSQLLTKLLIKKIVQPIEELNLAAKRINNGDLEKKIGYKNKDEFYEVCETFDSMQVHLKDGLERNAAYEKARTEMISGISHDLRTPLTSVKGFIKGMLDGVATTPEKQKQYLEISYKKACDMEILLQKLFFFSKLETGNMPFFKQRIELGKLVENYAKEKQSELQEKKVTVQFDSDKLEHVVNIDIEQMKRVFDNIIENSMKYADIDHLVIQMKISKKNNSECICITDNGRGVEKEKLPHLFEQFYRGDESRNSKNDGSGLGLYVCKYIIEKHGGKIEAMNQGGLSILIELPKHAQMPIESEELYD